MRRTIVGKGVDIDIQIDRHSALEIACTSNAYKCFEYPLSKGTSPKETYEPKLKTILRKFVKILIEKGTNVNAITTDYMISLHYACKSGSLEIVSYLISKGADNQIESISSLPSTLILHLSRCIQSSYNHKIL